jgi:predicted transposase YbfD/YdcC
MAATMSGRSKIIRSPFEPRLKTRLKRTRSTLNTQARKADLRSDETVDKGHGRIDKRRIETLTRIPSLIDFPGVKQIARITRERTAKGKTTIETVCIVTSLSRRRAPANKLLNLIRSHWSIENRVHRVRDVTMGEDACTVASGNAPEVLAVLRNAAISLIRKTGLINIASAIRGFAACPQAALDLLARAASDF